MAAGFLAGLAADGDSQAMDALAAIAGGSWRSAIELMARLGEDRVLPAAATEEPNDAILTAVGSAALVQMARAM